ncbi:hypothetical protein [Mucilaginibacter aquaedulcis]|uniref:hypothetical protein n=1 Tax=Mucilaginibacter aquaedulcis TaxID=1187081 RepID=UPI0025B581F8|nr:hypothetical protein [Mucilaginibacter aquaedulcis]MDN3548947.1 hypothetical protein [Mucilaginibacter aquaedulcis]
MKKHGLLLVTVFFLSLAVYAQKKKEKEVYNTIDNLKGELTIGLGMVLDTPSQLSYQYSFYDLLSYNPIISANGAKMYPVLTLRRGLTSYYVEGIYSKNAVDLKVWQKNTLLKTVRISPKDAAGDRPGEKDLLEVYKQLTFAITGTSHSDNVKLKKTDSFEPMDNLVNKDIGNIGTFIYSSAINYIPEIDFKTDIYMMYTGPSAQTEYSELKELKGSKFKFKDISEYIEKNHPELPLLFQTPKFFPQKSLDQAQIVQRLYGVNHSNHFFFDSKFVDDKAKIACRKIAFPMWKRSGTILTYFQAGQNFLDAGYPDAAVESFHSALAMCDAANISPKLIYYLKSRIYDGIAKAQSNLGYSSSMNYAIYMKDFTDNLSKANIIIERDDAFKKLSTEVSTYFVKIENTAYTARSQKRAAFWNTLTSVVMATASAANDGLNGASTLSPETQSLLNVAGDNAAIVSDFKMNSLSSSSEATLAFNNIYGTVIRQMQENKGESAVAAPVFAIDFVKKLGDNDLAKEKKDAFLAYAEHVPIIKESLTKYFAASGQEQQALIRDIFKKLAGIEFSLSVKESIGENPDLASISRL